MKLPHGRVVLFGFPIVSYGLIIVLFFTVYGRIDIVIVVLVFWISLFAMFTGAFPLPNNRYFVFVYNRRKALWVGLLQFLVASLITCLIILIESDTIFY